MKYFLSSFLIIISFTGLYAQKVDSIFFHLYTDSLKKGTHNYINVDGKLSTGKWQPLTDKEIFFSSSYGDFEGNELIIPVDCKEEKVKIKAVLRDEPSKWKEITIWVKKKPDDEKLPTKEEVLRNTKPQKQKEKKKN